MNRDYVMCTLSESRMRSMSLLNKGLPICTIVLFLVKTVGWKLSRKLSGLL